MRVQWVLWEHHIYHCILVETRCLTCSSGPVKLNSVANDVIVYTKSLSKTAYFTNMSNSTEDHLPDQFLWESSMGTSRAGRQTSSSHTRSSALRLWRLSCSFRIWYPPKIAGRGYLCNIIDIKSYPFQITWLPGLDCESQPTSFQSQAKLCAGLWRISATFLSNLGPSENKNWPTFCLHGPVSTLTRCCKVQKCGWVQD